MEIISANTLRRGLLSVLNRAEHKGESFQIMRYGRPCAVLGPIAEHVIVTDPATALPAGATVGKAQEPEAAPLEKNSAKNPKRNSRKTR